MNGCLVRREMRRLSSDAVRPQVTREKLNTEIAEELQPYDSSVIDIAC